MVIRFLRGTCEVIDFLLKGGSMAVGGVIMVLDALEQGMPDFTPFFPPVDQVVTIDVNVTPDPQKVARLVWEEMVKASRTVQHG